MRIASCSLAVILLVSTVLSGCIAVKPWERGRLAHPCMELAPQLGDGFRTHMLPIREGAIGGEAGMGGGCGCN